MDEKVASLTNTSLRDFIFKFLIDLATKIHQPVNRWREVTKKVYPTITSKRKETHPINKLMRKDPAKKTKWQQMMDITMRE